MYALVDGHRAAHGVEPICAVLQIAPSAYRRHAARRRDQTLLSTRTRRDGALMPVIEQVWNANVQVYGADKVWKQMNREGVAVARCTVERLMRRLGMRGVKRGKVISNHKAPYPLDKVNDPASISRTPGSSCEVPRFKASILLHAGAACYRDCDHAAK